MNVEHVAAVMDQIGVWLGTFVFPHALLNLILMAKLNPLFDPDLRADVSQEGFRAGYSRALHYSGAVATRRGKTVQGWSDYDFRAKVGPATVFWCRVNLLCLVLGFAGMLVFGLKELLVWWFRN